MATFRCEAVFEVLPNRFVLRGEVLDGVIQAGMTAYVPSGPHGRIALPVEGIEFVKVARVENLSDDRIGILVRCTTEEERTVLRALDGKAAVLNVEHG